MKIKNILSLIFVLLVSGNLISMDVDSDDENGNGRKSPIKDLFGVLSSLNIDHDSQSMDIFPMLKTPITQPPSILGSLNTADSFQFVPQVTTSSSQDDSKPKSPSAKGSPRSLLTAQLALSAKMKKSASAPTSSTSSPILSPTGSPRILPPGSGLRTKSWGNCSSIGATPSVTGKLPLSSTTNSSQSLNDQSDTSASMLTSDKNGN